MAAAAAAAQQPPVDLPPPARGGQQVQVVANALAATTRRAGRRSSLQPRAVGPFFLLSVVQLGTQVARSEYRPPFTLGVMVAQTLSYLRPGWLKMFMRVGRPISDVYMMPAAIIESLSPFTALRRMFLSAAVHGDHYHLYYNCATWLWQGTQLESRLGSRVLAKLVGTLTVTTHTIFVVGAWLLSFMGLDQPYYSVSVGFSNVLFALKMVMCYELPGGVAHIFGYPVRMQTEMWFELLLNWLLLPQTSVTAHISGIFAGYLYYEWSTLRPLDAAWQAGRSVIGFLPRWLTRPLGLDQVFRRVPVSPQRTPYRGGGVRLGDARSDARHSRGGPRWSPTRPLVQNPWAGRQAQMRRATLGTGIGDTVRDVHSQTADGGSGIRGLLRIAQARMLSLVWRTRRFLSRQRRTGGGLGIGSNRMLTPDHRHLDSRTSVPARRQQEQAPYADATAVQHHQGRTADENGRAETGPTVQGEVEGATGAGSPSLEELRQRRLRRFDDSSS